MRIAVDTNALYTTRAGAARYVRGLLYGLRQVKPPEMEILEFGWPVENFEYRQPVRALKTVSRELVWSNLVSPARLRRQGVDLLHITGGLALRCGPRTRCVATLLDCAVLRSSKRFRRWQRVSTAARLRQLSRSEKLICISRFTADEAMQLLGVDSKQIEVIYLGNSFDPKEGLIKETQPTFALPQHFFLFVGSLEPGKNLSLLRQTYLLARQKRIELPPLVIVGERWAGVPSEGEPPSCWFYAGRQSDEVLMYCYKRALALVFPSQYEGFGLPVVEAMSLGCPVICSPVASLREVGGDATYFADQNADSYLKAMRQISRSQKLRSELVERGRSWATGFSWKKCASETVEVYRTVLE